MTDAKPLFTHEDFIHAYSRADALEDGVLIDVSPLAREAGFRYPVALTQALWADIRAIPERAAGQDVEGRLWDVLFLGVQAIRAAQERGDVPSDSLFYSLSLPVGSRNAYRVKLVCGPGDAAEPVITLLRPEED